MCRPDNTKNQSGVYIKLEGLNTSVVWVRPSQPPRASCMVDGMTASAPSTEGTCEEHRRGALLFSFTAHCPLTTLFSMIVGRSRHVVLRFLVPPKRCHLRIIGGDKIADGYAHRSGVEELPGRIVVRCRNFQDIACRKFVTAILDKQLHGHGLKMPLSVRLRIQRCHGLFARHILQDNLLSVVVQVSAHAD